MTAKPLHPLVLTTGRAGLLVLTDGVILGVPLLSMLWLLALLCWMPCRAAWLLYRRKSLPMVGAGWLIWLCAIALAMGLCYGQARYAERQATRVVQALAQYRAARGVYPPDLQALVPTYLAEVPALGIGLLSGGFHYRPDRQPDQPPRLFYGVLPRYAYHFGTRRWRDRD
ncbi:hypothetical protein [Chitinimonas lacunae]|uniref:DUF4129 domain-containing protein n=1 Tax=Chitinimonas lacunae TaxID=1963018 RepID=A0ABV8ML46_9NEIS